MDGLDALAEHIFDASRRATVAAIAALPPGTYRAEIGRDGYEAPVTLQAAMTIAADAITVDFAGTSGLSTRGINVPAAYTRAYTAFGIKVVVAPDIPNNTASLEPFRCVIPEGCILNAPRPYPVAVRHVIGHLLPDLVMGCLHQAVPDRVAAEGASCLWNPPLRGGGAVSGQGTANRPVLPDFEVITFNSRRHRRAADAGRAGRHGVSLRRAHHAGGGDGGRGADRDLAQGAARRQRRRRADARRLGQVMEIGGRDDLEFACNAIFDRVANAPQGRDGGWRARAGG